MRATSEGDGDHRARRTIAVPTLLAAFLQRVMALPAGVHTVIVVKVDTGADGVLGWDVREGEGQLEHSRH